jgi:hypothetical protein
LQTGHQEAEKELMDLQVYVKQLEDKLHKEGNWWVAKETNMKWEDRGSICEQGPNT